MMRIFVWFYRVFYFLIVVPVNFILNGFRYARCYYLLSKRRESNEYEFKGVDEKYKCKGRYCTYEDNWPCRGCPFYMKGGNDG